MERPPKIPIHSHAVFKANIVEPLTTLVMGAAVQAYLDGPLGPYKTTVNLTAELGSPR